MRRFPVQLCAMMLTAGVAYCQNSIVKPELTPAEDDESAYYEPGGETFIGTGSVAWNAMLRDSDEKRALQEARKRKMMYHQIAQSSGPMPTYNTAASFLKANPPVAAPPLQGQRPVSTVRQQRPGEEVPAFERSYGSPQPESEESGQVAAQPIEMEQEKPGFLSKIFKRVGKDKPAGPEFQASPYTGGESAVGSENSDYSYPNAEAEPLESELGSSEPRVDTEAMDEALAQATNTPREGADQAGARQSGFLGRIFERRKRPAEVAGQPQEPTQPPAPAASSRPPGFEDDPSVARALDDGEEEESSSDTGEAEGERVSSDGTGLDEGGIPRPPAPGT